MVRVSVALGAKMICQANSSGAFLVSAGTTMAWEMRRRQGATWLDAERNKAQASP
ncbi:hypothetical protein XVE_0545 [Xanthomonas vesicatoria ATCC 35937]|uniref:Uncharacterized protein n=1 Tax=Xanthomonas vesicatoria ATCC 35937 TaxID=925775 RepID=F0B8Z3_9XANT|nr:hypothetical protein XVE_0545 [Xanthomonas vesicatoria ATCC 35937]